MKLKNLGLTVATTGLLLSGNQIVQAQNIFSNDGIIQFEQDTIIEFEFIESHGAYQSTFGVVDLDSCQASFDSVDLDTCQKIPLLVETKASDLHESVARTSDRQDDFAGTMGTYIKKDFLGSPGNAVPKFLAEFMFEAGKRYAFYLESFVHYEKEDGQEGIKPAGIQYSYNLYNRGNNQQALFTDYSNYEILQAQRRSTLNDSFAGDLKKLVNGGIMIRWDDTGSELVSQEQEDVDFDDFVIVVGGELDCY